MEVRRILRECYVVKELHSAEVCEVWFEALETGGIVHFTQTDLSAIT